MNVTVPVQPVIAPVGLGHLLSPYLLLEMYGFAQLGHYFEVAKIASLCHKRRTSIVEFLGVCGSDIPWLAKQQT